VAVGSYVTTLLPTAKMLAGKMRLPFRKIEYCFHFSVAGMVIGKN
jgi:hypothetical protein